MNEFLDHIVFLALYCLLASCFVCCSVPQDIHKGECQAPELNTGLFESGVVDPSTVINSWEVKDHCLVLHVIYSGGCADHSFSMAARAWIKTDPPKVEARIIHENMDPCEAEIKDTLYFDLVPLRYGVCDTLVILLEGLEESIIHVYTK